MLTYVCAVILKTCNIQNSTQKSQRKKVCIKKYKKKNQNFQIEIL